MDTNRLKVMLNEVSDIKGKRKAMNYWFRCECEKLKPTTVNWWLGTSPKILDRVIIDVYNEYVEYCHVKHKRPFKRTKFGIEMTSFGYVSKVKTIKGANYRVYDKVTDYN